MYPTAARVVPLLLLGACALPPAAPAEEGDAPPAPAAPQDQPGATATTDPAQVEESAQIEESAEAQAEDEEPDANLTGDWGGLRPWLEEQGLQIELSATSDVAQVVHGGAHRGQTTQVLWDAAATADLDRLIGWRGASAYLEWWTRPGPLLNDDVGDWQGTSNIDTPHRSELYEAWLEAWPAPDVLRVKLGKLDVFDDFAVVESAADFLNNGMAYSPTLSPMPSYPDSAYGGLLFGYPAQATWVGAGVFDGSAQQGVKTGTHGASTLFGSPSDLFMVGEVGHSWPREGGALAGRAALGAWRHSGDYQRFEGGGQEGVAGAYAIFEQELWAEEPEQADDVQGLTFFVQLATTDKKVIEVARAVAAGVQWVGPLAERDEDILGLGATRADFSDEPGAGFTRDHELALETFYRWQATPWLAIQPDVQYVLDPGGDAALDDALVVTLRFEATL
ncbi:MAG TPA: carbohydrate porin [Planctomycetota bacterium]|nr:carbohydrate porin [Planctomycetota bacterium]